MWQKLEGCTTTSIAFTDIKRSPALIVGLFYLVEIENVDYNQCNKRIQRALAC